jgi:hypothetical protein
MMRLLVMMHVRALADEIDQSPRRTRAFVVAALRGVAAAHCTIDEAIVHLAPPVPAA